MAARAAYSELHQTFTRVGHLQHALRMLQWDTMVRMPPGAMKTRSATTAELELAVHSALSNPRLPALVQNAAAGDGLTDAEKASVREMTRVHAKTVKVDPALVEKKAHATAESRQAWQKCRAANDFASFLPHLEAVVELSKEEGKQIAKDSNLSAYDALLDQYEPGMRSVQAKRHFDDLSEWLPHAIKFVTQQKQGQLEAAGKAPVRPQGPFAVDAQRQLAEKMMPTFGLDMERTRLDVSAHPFCGGVPTDTRITTRFTEDDFVSSLMGVIHESGHARYEQHLPSDWAFNPAGEARGMGVHESQSLLAEMQHARSAPFLSHLAPLLDEAYPAAAAAHPGVFGVDNLTRLYTWVQPGKIRVDADEMCYPLHVALRFEIEKGLIDDGVAPKDVPALWARKMKEYLDVDTAGDDKDGCLQDIHWPMGLFGYFPTYTLGAMYAAQFAAALRKDIGGDVVDAALSSGDQTPIVAWLDEKVWSHGSLLTTPELLRQATGEEFNSAHFKNHLMSRYVM